MNKNKELLMNLKNLESMINELNKDESPLLCAFNFEDFYINMVSNEHSYIIDFKKDFVIGMLNLENGLNALAEFIHVYIKLIDDISLGLKWFLQDFIIEHLQEDEFIDWARLDTWCKTSTKNKNAYLSIKCVTSNCLHIIKENHERLKRKNEERGINKND